jgi:hypothetical protein
MSRSQVLSAQPCPFCGGPPVATRLERTKANGRHTVIMGCAGARRCDAFLVVRGTSFGDALMRWNMRHLPDEVVLYALAMPALDQPTVGVQRTWP